MSVARPALVATTLAAAVALSGCNEEGKMTTTARSVQALSPELVSLMTEKGMAPQDPILLRVFKEESKAEVWKKRKSDGRYSLLKSYDICRFSGRLGPKLKEGDKQAPEGFYSVAPAQMNPKSSYYLSFNIGFPNAYDRALGRSGQHVMMHGDCLSAGCYAMTDAQMGEIYAMARESFRGGQKAFQVQALPFRMTAQNMARRRNDANMKFWKNLKQGSDNFEVAKLEPKVDVCGKKYVFNAQAGPLSTFAPDAACPSYQVEPSIAKAVVAKEKTDSILIAQLSKTEPLAPEYIAQNGRLRRTLDQPVVMMAAVAPEAVGAPMAATQTATGGMALASATPEQSVGALKSGQPTQVALSTPVATTGSAPAPSPAPSFTQVASAKPAAAPGPAVVSGPPAKSGAPAAREVSADQRLVMASSVSSSPAERGAVDKLRGWVGDLFGGKAAEEPVAAPAPAATPATYAPPAVAPKKNRSANLPPELAPKSRTDPKITSSYAETE